MTNDYIQSNQQRLEMMYAAAQRLDAELRGLPWFVSVGVRTGDEPGLCVYVTDLMPKNTKAVGVSFEGWDVDVVVSGWPRPAFY